MLDGRDASPIVPHRLNDASDWTTESRWRSARYARWPADLTVDLPGPTIVDRIDIVVAANATPTAVVLFDGRRRRRIGVVEFEPIGRRQQRRVVFESPSCGYRLIVSVAGCHEAQSNTYNQVHLVALRVHGRKRHVPAPVEVDDREVVIPRRTTVADGGEPGRAGRSEKVDGILCDVGLVADRDLLLLADETGDRPFQALSDYCTKHLERLQRRRQRCLGRGLQAEAGAIAVCMTTIAEIASNARVVERERRLARVAGDAPGDFVADLNGALERATRAVADLDGRDPRHLLPEAPVKHAGKPTSASSPRIDASSLDKDDVDGQPDPDLDQVHPLFELFGEQTTMAALASPSQSRRLHAVSRICAIIDDYPDDQVVVAGRDRIAGLLAHDKAWPVRRMALHLVRQATLDVVLPVCINLASDGCPDVRRDAIRALIEHWHAGPTAILNALTASGDDWRQRLGRLQALDEIVREFGTAEVPVAIVMPFVRACLLHQHPAVRQGAVLLCNALEARVGSDQTDAFLADVDPMAVIGGSLGTVGEKEHHDPAPGDAADDPAPLAIHAGASRAMSPDEVRQMWSL
ncbi:SUI1 domain-containing protein [Plasmodiophora brassicae]